MAKQIYIDSNGNEVMVSGTITNDNNLPHYSGTPTAGTTAYEIANKISKTDIKQTSVTLSGSGGQYISSIVFDDVPIINAWVQGYAFLVIVRKTDTGKVAFNIYNYSTGNSRFEPITFANVTVNYQYIDIS